ncbi:hypothetical protein Q2T41_02545 [Maribacter confluentis]|uniref:Host attachment protein n=1 Tax=Maribacter confluentis TaxID=1656093 RepID=A0ABT8RL96_9FLAO|nr:hypothetical protein [Maribacter confluentis]MDO1511545.1 hypothetical protein [Maribacter confluentis]
MKNTGIWLNSKHAYVVHLTNGKEEMESIASNIEFFNRTGTGGSRKKTGATQDISKEKKYLEKSKIQFKTYFKAIATAIEHSDRIVLFGPADIDQKLSKELTEHYPAIAQKLLGTVKVDRMSQNEIVALVRDYYLKNQ